MSCMSLCDDVGRCFGFMEILAIFEFWLIDALLPGPTSRNEAVILLETGSHRRD